MDGSWHWCCKLGTSGGCQEQSAGQLSCATPHLITLTFPDCPSLPLSPPSPTLIYDQGYLLNMPALNADHLCAAALRCGEGGVVPVGPAASAAAYRDEAGALHMYSGEEMQGTLHLPTYSGEEHLALLQVSQGAGGKRCLFVL